MQQIESNTLKRKIIAKIIIGIGSLILFGSWLTQNYYSIKWQDTLNDIQRSKQTISYNEINKNMFSIFVNQLQLLDSFNLDKSVYATYAYCKYALTVHLQGLRMATENKDTLKMNDVIYRENIEDLDRWRINKDIVSLTNFSSKLSKWENANGSNTVAGFQGRYFATREKAQRANGQYLIIYIIGALFLGVGFVIELLTDIKYYKKTA